MKHLALIFLAVLMNTVAQIGLKMGMRGWGHLEFSGFFRSWGLLVQVFCTPYVFGSILLYGVSLMTWMVVLSRVDVSYAYPLTALGYVLTALVGYFFLHEQVSWLRFMGIVVIVIGVYLVARS